MLDWLYVKADSGSLLVVYVVGITFPIEGEIRNNSFIYAYQAVVALYHLSSLHPACSH